MRVDKGLLRAYLDGELAAPERETVEQWLVSSPEAQTMLAQLDQTREQVNQALAALTPAAPSSAMLALKRFQTQLGADSSRDGTPAKDSALTVWESPSLLTEIKNDVKNMRCTWRKTVTKGFVFATMISLVIVISAIALAVWPNIDLPVAQELQQAAPAEGVNVPVVEANKIETTTVVVALQPISRGAKFVPGSIGHRSWPTPHLPAGFISSEIETVDKIARTDIAAGQVIVQGMLMDASAYAAPFGYGIQADPNGDAELNIPAIQELGFEWVKFQMPWKIVEPTAGNYDWTTWDQVIDAYAAKNIKVMLNIVKAPDWARPADDDRNVEGPASDPAQYASFVAKVAQRYQGKVQAIEVWDEQNMWYKAGGQGRMNPIDYVKLLQQAYPAIKAANPEMLIISGGLTPAGNVEDLAIDDVEYLNQMYANGVKGYFDALGAHPAGYNCPALADWRTVTAAEAGATSFLEPFTTRHHSWCFLGTLEAYREVMVANGDGDKAVAITEFGWAVGDSPQPGYTFALDNTPVERAKWLVEAYQWGKKQGWVGPMILWNLDYSLTTPVTELGYFSIYYTSTYEALVKMPK